MNNNETANEATLKEFSALKLYSIRLESGKKCPKDLWIKVKSTGFHIVLLKHLRYETKGADNNFIRPTVCP